MVKKDFKQIIYFIGIVFLVLGMCILVIFLLNKFGIITSSIKYDDLQTVSTKIYPKPVQVIDRTLYDQYMNKLANYIVKPFAINSTSTDLISTKSSSTNIIGKSLSTLKNAWPVDAPYPNTGAILPFGRIVAYYGNFYSGSLGVLGAYPTEEMVTRLLSEVNKWQIADPETKVIPALDYIAITAQGSPGSDGMYRARMPGSEIQKAVDIANRIGGLVILDVQVGKSTLEKEIPTLESFLKLPNVELAIDPEFSMKNGKAPGRSIGSFDAVDINYAAEFLAKIVKDNNLPPKVLVIHRFTEGMITNYENIQPLPDVQILIDMDGYGTPAQKTKVYRQVITSEPVQFTGLKLFYKNDVKYGGTMMTPEQAMKLQPRPSFIQYQ